ncbi:MAG: nucleotide exchange factor GrpE [Acidimicrobiia bacterium]
MAEESTEPSVDGGADVVDASVDPDASTDSMSELDRISAERDEYLDLARRVQAEYENYRKRVSAQTADDIDRATGRVAESLLPVLDACEAAFVAHPAEVEPLFNLLLGELKKQGLEAMHLHGQPFDPAMAEAVMHEPGDGDGATVIVDVLRSGYTWKGRVLRAALVKVKG